MTLAPPDDTATRAIAIHSLPEDAPADHPWTLHATGTLAGDAQASGTGELVAWPPERAEAVDSAGMYDRLAAVGYGYGPAF